MPIIQVVQPQQTRKSGGFLSSLGGAVGGLASLAGLAAAPFTGGLSAAVPAGLIGGGAALASGSNLVGSVVDPAKITQTGGTGVPVQSAQRKLDIDTSAQSAYLNQAKQALQSQDEETRRLFEPILNHGQSLLQSRIG